MSDIRSVSSFFKPRNPFSHKGDYGHALLLAGSYGMMGAAVLAVRSCLRGGTGKLTVRVPAAGYSIIQTAVPEAMASTDPDAHCLSRLPDLTPYDAVGIGPGLGTCEATRQCLDDLMEVSGCLHLPMVVDADALNILSLDSTRLKRLPPRTVLTPHRGEFRRLLQADGGIRLPETEDDWVGAQAAFVDKYQVTVVLKGHRSSIMAPGGRRETNPTGNAGMATGGSGDVLTGLLLAFLSQLRLRQVASDADACGRLFEAATAACFVHGLAGDMAADEVGELSLTAGDLIRWTGHSILKITTQKHS